MTRKAPMALPADLIVGETMEQYHARKAPPTGPRLVLGWVTIRPSKRSKKPVRVECMWSLKGGNNEHMCGSWPEGFRDARDALRSAEQCGHYLGRIGAIGSVGLTVEMPGPRPKDDEVTP